MQSVMRFLSTFLVLSGVSGLRVGLAVRMAAPTVRMVAPTETPAASSSQGRVTAGSDEQSGWQLVVSNARGRASAVKAEQDATVGAMAAATTAVFALPLVDNIVADLFLSLVIGGGAAGYLAGFDTSAAGDAARALGGGVSVAASSAMDKIAETGVLEKVKAKLPGSGGEGLSMADIKKYGIAGTLAYILTGGFRARHRRRVSHGTYVSMRDARHGRPQHLGALTQRWLLSTARGSGSPPALTQIWLLSSGALTCPLTPC